MTTARKLWLGLASLAALLLVLSVVVQGVAGVGGAIRVLLAVAVVVAVAASWIVGVQADQALQASESIKGSILRSALDAILTIDAGGRIVEFNPAAETLFGYTRAEALGREMAELIIPQRLQGEHRAGMARYLSTGVGPALNRRLEMPAHRKDGTEILVELSIIRLEGEPPLFTGFVRDITQETQSETRVYSLMTELKEADRRKDEFLATLAHELRGPLAPLHNSLEIMKRAEGDAQIVEQARATMERQMSQMERLIDDLLDISRITRNKLELRRVRIDLASVVRQAVETARPLVEVAKHKLVVSLPPQPIDLEADPARLAQVLSNLLSNAAKYTEPGGHIALSAERQGSDVVVSVHDTGIGIPPDQLGNIFEMFSQVERSQSRSQGGLGIGLTLVRRLVEMHGGSVEASSEGPGRGSRFTVRLPLPMGPAQVPPPEPVIEPPTVPARRILVVDDNQDAARSLATLLSLSGNETCIAHDGLEAVQAAGEFRPDVVLLDIGLPKLSGHEAAIRIRQQPWGRSMLLIALTGWSQEEDRRRSSAAGFDHHLVKPVDYNVLVKLLDQRDDSRSLPPVGNVSA